MSAQPATRDIREVIVACEVTEEWLELMGRHGLVAVEPAGATRVVEAELRFQAQRVSHVTPSENDELSFFSDLARRYTAAAGTLWTLSMLRVGMGLDVDEQRETRAALSTVAKLRRYHEKRLNRVPGQTPPVIDSIPGADAAIDGAGNAVAYTGDE